MCLGKHIDSESGKVEKMKIDSNDDIIEAITRQIDVENQMPADEKFCAFFEKATKDTEKMFIGTRASAMVNNSAAIQCYKAFL